MVEVTDEQMAQEAEGFLRMKRERRTLDDRLEACGRLLRKGLSERHTNNGIFGGNVVRLVRFQAARVPDVERMRRDGIFAAYSKDRIAGERLQVCPEGEMQGRPVPNDGIPF